MQRPPELVPIPGDVSSWMNRGASGSEGVPARGAEETHPEDRANVHCVSYLVAQHTAGTKAEYNVSA